MPLSKKILLLSLALVSVVLVLVVWSQPYLQQVWGKKPARLSFDQLKPSKGLRDWNQWYPVNFGQKQSERVINWWNSTQQSDIMITGMSYLNVPDKLPTLPARYQGKKLDFYYLWQCMYPWGDKRDPKCLRTEKYLEIISQTKSANYQLTTWSRGSTSAWEVYYDADKLGGVERCNRRDLIASGVDLSRPDYKKPLVFRLPEGRGQFALSEPVCAVVFDGYQQTANRIIDSRYQKKVRNAFETGNWLVMTVVKDYFTDEQGQRVIDAENIYLTDNLSHAARFSQSYCSQQRDDQLHCLAGQGVVYPHQGRNYRIFAFEEYWMRQVKYVNQKVAGQMVKAKYGFGAFRWWQKSELVDWDKVTGLPSRKKVSHSSEYQLYLSQKCQLSGTPPRVKNCE